MKFSKERRLTQCLNCFKVLKKTDNFCPECGQENADHKVSIGLFLKDFLSNYLAVDTSLGRTLVPFLFKPGTLTNTFNQGKRKKFIHPIRLYLILSLFYFFTISYIIPYDLLDRFTDGISIENQNNTENEELSSFYAKNDKEKIDSLVKNNPKLNALNLDSAMESSNSIDINSLKKDWKKLKLVAVDNAISQEAYAATVEASVFSSIGTLRTARARKFLANSNVFIVNVAKNLPLMMFLLLPIFAFLLWLLHLSSGTFYIENLVHALHLHSFAYLLYGIGIILLTLSPASKGIMALALFFLVTFYAFISIKRVYKNSYLKAFIKFNLLGIIYIVFLFFAVFLELYLSYISL